jgi:hypothetical protein
MKQKILFILGALGVGIMMYAFRLGTELKKERLQHPGLKKGLIACGPDWESLKEVFEETDIPPIPGAGSYSWKISTKNDSAQFYFNQGINMYYSFHIIEAMASFKKAVKFDPNSAMLYWAQALAYGPNINDLGYAASPEALFSIEKATQYASGANAKEKFLIQAQFVRYSADSTQSREKLNQNYADKMKQAYDKFPNDADVAALYADALMLQHPWDLWHHNGTPKPWTPRIRTVLENLLVKTPDHPGANHYYIHVMEPSPFFAKALPSADRLGKLTPGLSHTVHMPSHIYLRAGHYEKGVTVNENAVNGYRKALNLYSPVAANDFLYVIHNVHMQANNAIMGGNKEKAIASARETFKSINPDYYSIQGAMGNYLQYILMTPVLTHVRFSNWSEILLEPVPDSKMIYATLLHHFGRGMSYANQSRFAEAKHELERVELLIADSSLYLPFTPFSSAIEGAKVAKYLLAGTIAEKENRLNDAIDHFKMAVSTEEKMVYNEPRDWMLNPKAWLGNAYLKAGKFTVARKTFQSDLVNNNNNVWSLHGLMLAYKAEKNKIEEAKTKARFVKMYGALEVKW